MTSHSPADRHVTFDSVYVLEFLGPLDDQTGLNLFRKVLEPRGLSHNIYTCHIDVHHPTSFVPSLWQVHKECEERHLSPFIHFETHGTSTGLGLDPTTMISWEELVPPLRAINTVSRMNLVVTLAACHGLSFVRALTPLEASPVWAMLGPNEQVFQSEIEKGFATFYGVLLDTLNLSAALTALRAEVLQPEAWLLRSAEFFFSVVFGHFLEDAARPGDRQARERKLVKKLQRRARKDPNLRLPLDIRRRVRDDIADDESHFQRYKKRFLMLNDFPENEKRFPLTRDDCLATWSAQREAYEAAG